MSGTLCLAFALTTAGAVAAPGDEEALIRAEIRGYLDAWNAGDAERLASFYTEDGDRANNRGDIFRGRAAILEHYRRVFGRAPPAGVARRLTYHQVDVRIVSTDAAVVDVTYEVSGISADVSRTTRGRNTVFMIRRDARWMRTAHRNSLPVSPACLNVCAERQLLPWQR